MTDTPDLPDDTPDDCLHDNYLHDNYGSIDHARALRLILACLRQDWSARDQILEEIGECLGCLQEAIRVLAAEAATAYLGPPERTPDGGFRIPEEQMEGAVRFISEILADVLDHQPS